VRSGPRTFANVAVRRMAAASTRAAAGVDRADSPMILRTAATRVSAIGLLVSACAMPDGAALEPATPRHAPSVVLVGAPCEGCEAVFEQRPAALGASATIAGPEEPGERLVITGLVTDERGRPARNIVVYAYHTDANGLYPPAPAGTLGPAATRHGRLRGFVVTGDDGAYQFATIRPGGYPGSDTPEHVHMHVVEEGCHYYIDDLMFRDDPRLTPEQQGAHSPGRGGPGIVTPMRTPDGGWIVHRDILLGAGIADHARCGAR
jgi:protocatechuate 3,4-dioxygenase beta subunit